MKSSERLLEVLKYTKKSKHSLGKELGHGSGVTIGYIVNERNGISAKVAAAICDNYSEISYDWIMNNKGELYGLGINQYQILLLIVLAA